jgi:hypothetical protein
VVAAVDNAQVVMVDNVAGAVAAAVPDNVEATFLSQWLQRVLRGVIEIPQYIASLTPAGYTTEVTMGLLTPEELVQCIGNYVFPMHEDALVSALQELRKTTAQALPKAADCDTTTEYLKALDSSFSDDEFTTVKNCFDAWGGNNNSQVHHHIRGNQ